jgi:hypothetical protein
MSMLIVWISGLRLGSNHIELSHGDATMHVHMALAVLVTAPGYPDPILSRLSRQLERWQTLNEQCHDGVSYSCEETQAEKGLPTNHRAADDSFID